MCRSHCFALGARTGQFAAGWQKSAPGDRIQAWPRYCASRRRNRNGRAALRKPKTDLFAGSDRFCREMVDSQRQGQRSSSTSLRPGDSGRQAKQQPISTVCSTADPYYGKYGRSWFNRLDKGPPAGCDPAWRARPGQLPFSPKRFFPAADVRKVLLGDCHRACRNCDGVI